MESNTMEKVKERPILFKGEMVRAILEDRKTQTRRPVKTNAENILEWKKTEKGFQPWGSDQMCYGGRIPVDNPIKSPYGVSGDRLWVKETWMYETEQGCKTGGIIYAATSKPEPDGNTKLKWKPSLFMPRLASRINLEITDLRIERLNDISEEDAEAEGAERLCHPKNDDTPPFDDTGYFPQKSFSDGFRLIWESINGPGSWEKNPWVWVIEFRRIK